MLNIKLTFRKWKSFVAVKFVKICLYTTYSLHSKLERSNVCNLLFPNCIMQTPQKKNVSLRE